MLKPDHFVFVDINLASCKSLLVRRVICGVGAPLLFLPSPQPGPQPSQTGLREIQKIRVIYDFQCGMGRKEASAPSASFTVSLQSCSIGHHLEAACLRRRPHVSARIPEAARHKAWRCEGSAGAVGPSSSPGPSGPAGLTICKQIRHLPFRETIGIPDVSQGGSVGRDFTVSANDATNHECERA